MKKILFSFAVILIIGLLVIRSKKLINSNQSVSNSQVIVSGMFDESKKKTNEEWKKILTPQQYHILREAGTEIPFTGELNNEKRKGTYYSVGCDKPLFRSEQKYDSRTGWPSFWAPISENALVLHKESALGDDRIEVLDTCGGHLGHLFADGPKPSGKRYCINSIALRFVPDSSNSLPIQASFAIFTHGTFRVFTNRMYHNLSQDVYIESSNPNVLHVKKAGTTWNDFFTTLPFNLTSECLTTGTKETFCTGNRGTLKFYINGVKNIDVLNQEIKENDKLLVTFGSESEAQIKQQIAYD